jgi:hypothetical protein
MGMGQEREGRSTANRRARTRRNGLRMQCGKAGRGCGVAGPRCGAAGTVTRCAGWCACRNLPGLVWTSVWRYAALFSPISQRLASDRKLIHVKFGDDTPQRGGCATLGGTGSQVEPQKKKGNVLNVPFCRGRSDQPLTLHAAAEAGASHAFRKPRFLTL